MRKRAPVSLTRRLPLRHAALVERWWQGLAPGARRTLRVARAPAGVVARFVEPGSADDDGEASVDFYEYLVNHEVTLTDGRTFHICSAHPAARAVLAAGHLPAAFVCPRRDTACPMRALLDASAGLDVRLSLARTEPA
jgi:hypothetical protein